MVEPGTPEVCTVENSTPESWLGECADGLNIGPLVVESGSGDRLEVDALSTWGCAVAEVRRLICDAWGWPAEEVLLVDNGGSVILDGDDAALCGKAGVTACRKRPGRALSASADSRLIYWDLEAGIILRILEGHIGAVNCVAADFPGMRAISGSSDSTLRVWDLTSGETTQKLQGHMGPVTCLAADVGALHALSGSADGTLRLWELATGLCSRTYRTYSNGVKCLVADFSVQQALSGSEDGKIRIWDLAQGRCTQVLEADGGYPVHCLAADFYCLEAVSVSQDLVMSVWDLSSGQCVSELRGHCAVMECVAAEFGVLRRAVTGGDDGRLVCWDLSNGGNGTCLGALGNARPTDVSGIVHCLAADFTVGLALSGLEDGTLAVFDLQTGSPLLVLYGHGARVRCVVAQFGDAPIAGCVGAVLGGVRARYVGAEALVRSEPMRMEPVRELEAAVHYVAKQLNNENRLGRGGEYTPELLE